MAILTVHKDRRETIRRILARIAKLEGGARDTAFSKLMILAGLRKLGDSIRTEAGLHQGRQEEVLKVVRGLLIKRFGPLPAWVEERLANSPIAALEDLSLRLLDGPGIDELFHP